MAQGDGYCTRDMEHIARSVSYKQDWIVGSPGLYEGDGLERKKNSPMCLCSMAK